MTATETAPSIQQLATDTRERYLDLVRGVAAGNALTDDDPNTIVLAGGNMMGFAEDVLTFQERQQWADDIVEADRLGQAFRAECADRTPPHEVLDAIRKECEERAASAEVEYNRVLSADSVDNAGIAKLRAGRANKLIATADPSLAPADQLQPEGVRLSID